MKLIVKFVRENPTLAFGLGLPLLIVAIFLIASRLQEIGVEPPKYDVVFATNYDVNAYAGGGKGFHIEVRDKKAHVVYLGENPYYPLPKLYRYEVATQSLHEISFSLPEAFKSSSQINTDTKDNLKVTPVIVPELNTLMLDASRIAPDGYAFSQDTTAYSHDLLTGLFYEGRYNNGITLKKDGYTLHLPSRENNYESAQFIGWVVPQ